jgi:hypothetical protein
MPTIVQMTRKRAIETDDPFPEIFGLGGGCLSPYPLKGAASYNFKVN